MRKQFHAVLLAGVVLTFVSGASAQQKWSIPGPQNTHAHTQQHAQLRFPIPAAVYEAKISKALEKLRASRPVGPITQGDLNKVILLMRDCASRVESDGYVTIAEMTSCNNVVAQYKRQRQVEVLATSDSRDWQLWASQTHATQHHAPQGH